MTLEEYDELYHKVFNSKDEIKICGRELTSRLIRASKHMDLDRIYDNFGDEMTGMMNVQNIKGLHHILVR